jgi:3,4-dihydroxy 2-butanone 4-phosphate synthase/GTP cyclohydrolase II
MQSVPLALEHFRRGGLVLLFDQAGQAHLVVSAEHAGSAELALMQTVGIGAFSLSMTAPEVTRSVSRADLPKCQVVSAREGGLLESENLSEAATDLARLAGVNPQVLVRALPPQKIGTFDEAHGHPSVTITALTHYRRRVEAALDLVAVADLPTCYADRPFITYAYRSRFDEVEHVALVSPGKVEGDPLVRIHSECLTGDSFGSLRCDCGPQLQESMRRLGASPGGILIYMRGHEGRGIGFANKIRAYALQDKGLDTVEANRALGLPEDARDFGHAAQILRTLGYISVQLLTNNPEKSASLRRHGIIVSHVEPLIIPPNPFNLNYLDTKATKFGHTLPRTMANEP